MGGEVCRVGVEVCRVGGEVCRVAGHVWHYDTLHWKLQHIGKVGWVVRYVEWLARLQSFHWKL